MGVSPMDIAFGAAEAEAPDEGLSTVAAARARLEALEALQVEKAVGAGWSWRQIADALGVTKQAVHKKHARRIAEKAAAAAEDESKRLVVTGQARQSVRLAREEAEALRDPAVAPGHLLLGLLRQEQGAAAEALAEAGVSLAAARREVTRLRPRGARSGKRRAQPPPGERLPVAADARAVLEQSLREAVRRGDGHLGVEHLLLALVRDEASPAVRVLQSLGVGPRDIERALEEAIARAH